MDQDHVCALHDEKRCLGASGEKSGIDAPGILKMIMGRERKGSAYEDVCAGSVGMKYFRLPAHLTDGAGGTILNGTEFLPEGIRYGDVKKRGRGCGHRYEYR